MASLRAKLQAMSSGQPPRPSRPAPFLIERESRHPLPPGLAALPADALKRLPFALPFSPERAVFLDTETTGLSGGAGTVAFLVGLGVVEQGELVVCQFLMSDYGAEPLLLSAVDRVLDGHDIVVTFNGKSFDVPLLRSRFTMCRMMNRLDEMVHLDLIHPARRAWKLRLKDCSLGNLEEKVLGLTREGDIPGAEVPQRYFDYLKTGFFQPLEAVIDHNRQDIVSLGDLLVKLCAAFESPDGQTSLLDVFSLGKAVEKGGETELAIRCYSRAAKAGSATTPLSLRENKNAGHANWRMSVLLRRCGDYESCEKIWLDMAKKKQLGALPHVELAKMQEHLRRNPAAALDHATKALALADTEPEAEAIKKRIARLEKRIQGQKPQKIKAEEQKNGFI